MTNNIVINEDVIKNRLEKISKDLDRINKLSVENNLKDKIKNDVNGYYASEVSQIISNEINRLFMKEKIQGKCKVVNPKMRIYGNKEAPKTSFMIEKKDDEDVLEIAKGNIVDIKVECENVPQSVKNNENCLFDIVDFYQKCKKMNNTNKDCKVNTESKKYNRDKKGKFCKK